MSKDSALALATQSPTTQEPTPAGSPGLEAAPELKQDQAPEPKSLDSERFASFAKKEAEFVKRQQEFKRQREEWLANEKTKSDAILEKGKLFDETAKKNKIDALRLLGWSDTDIFNVFAEATPKDLTPEEKAARAAEEAAKKTIEEFQLAQKKAQEEAIQARDEALIKSFRSEMGKAVQSNPDKFEYCSFYGPVAEDLAYEFVLETTRQSQGKDIPTALEAMEMVEAFYEEQDQQMRTLKKRQPKETPAPEVKAEEAKAPERTRTLTTPAGSTPTKPALQRTRTLSNQATATVAATAKTTTANETPTQKRQRLIEALKRGHL